MRDRSVFVVRAIGLFALLGLSCAAAPMRVVDAPFYHSVAALDAELGRLAADCPYLERVDTDAVIAVRLRDSSSEQPPPRVHALFVFGEHAREPITTEVGLAFVRKICSTPAVSILKHVEFSLVLLANPRGRAIADAHPCFRPSASCVDLNRNWPFMWTPTERAVRPDGTCMQDREDHGTAPLSEPESLAIFSLAAWRGNPTPTLYVNVHSGAKEMYLPWDYSATPPERTPAIERMEAVLRSVAEQHCRCRWGSAGVITDYVALGTSADYFFSQGTNFSFTFEVYGDPAHDVDGNCFASFNPATEAEFEAVRDSWAAALETTAWAVAAQQEPQPGSADAVGFSDMTVALLAVVFNSLALALMCKTGVFSGARMVGPSRTEESSA